MKHIKPTKRGCILISGYSNKSGMGEWSMVLRKGVSTI